jgi:hypothetical protein
LIKPPRRSKSGKTLLIASSNGPKRTSLRIDGKPVVVNATAYIRPGTHTKEDKVERKARRRERRKKREGRSR